MKKIREHNNQNIQIHFYLRNLDKEKLWSWNRPNIQISNLLLKFLLTFLERNTCISKINDKFNKFSTILPEYFL